MLLTHPSVFLEIQSWQTWIFSLGLMAYLTAETLFPALRFDGWRARCGHLVVNLALWVLGAVAISVLVGHWAVQAQFWLEYNRIGLLRLVELPAWALLLIGVPLIDFGDYLFHRLSHRVRWLWLLHAVHHADEHLDVSTTLRAHPLHSFASLGWKLLLVSALGVPIWVAMIRDALAIPISQFHHANLRLPSWLESALRRVIVTPPIHRVHHEPEPAHTDANFGPLFVAWDKLCGTYVAPHAAVPPSYGLAAVSARGWRGLWSMLMLPWRGRRLPAL